jgi:hypothetical protein
MDDAHNYDSYICLHIIIGFIQVLVYYILIWTILCHM